MRPGGNKLRAGLRMTDMAGRVSDLPLARFRDPPRSQTRPTVCHGPFARLFSMELLDAAHGSVLPVVLAVFDILKAQLPVPSILRGRQTVGGIGNQRVCEIKAARWSETARVSS